MCWPLTPPPLRCHTSAMPMCAMCVKDKLTNTNITRWLLRASCAHSTDIYLYSLNPSIYICYTLTVYQILCVFIMLRLVRPIFDFAESSCFMRWFLRSLQLVVWRHFWPESSREISGCSNCVPLIVNNNIITVEIVVKCYDSFPFEKCSSFWPAQSTKRFKVKLACERSGCGLQRSREITTR